MSWENSEHEKIKNLKESCVKERSYLEQAGWRRKHRFENMKLINRMYCNVWSRTD